MLSTDTAYLNMNDSLARRIKGKVEHYSGSTLLGTYSYDDNLQNIHVDRTAASCKFFGFGITQKLTLKLTDKDKQLTVNKGDIFKIYFSANDSEYLRVGPNFTADDVKRDEKTNGLTITALCPLSELSKHTVAELTTINLQLITHTSYDFFKAIANYGLGMSFTKVESIKSGCGKNGYGYYVTNFLSTDNLKDVLDDVAEEWQAVYYCEGDKLCLKVLKSDDVAITIPKQDYYELTTGQSHTLNGIAHVTELGDNLQAGTDIVQVIRDNNFLTSQTIKTDVYTASEVVTQDVVLQDSAATIAGLTLVDISCSWRGNFALEIGDKIAIEDKQGNIVTTYLLNDSYEYNGGFKQTISWTYEEEKVESANPVTVSEKLSQTIAKVDRVNQEITLMASSVESQIEQIAQLQITTNGITGSVSKIEQTEQENIDAVNERIDTVSKEASMKLDAEGVEIVVQKTLSEGVEKVVTSTKHYTFDDTGLNISSSDSNISTIVTEDGMRIYRGNEEVLVADNEGVKAEDLHATTFLIIGETSRLEDRGNRTACFWIGD